MRRRESETYTMPIYEYLCEACEHTTEALRRMNAADEPQTCEACGSDKTHRKHSVFAAGGESRGDTALPMGGCGACGDPNGACPF